MKMKYLKPFNSINESMSDINKDYTNKIYNLFVKNGFGSFSPIELFHNYIMDKNELNKEFLMSDVTIIFKKSDEKRSGFFPQRVQMDGKIMKGVTFKFEFTDNMTEFDIKQEISHELSHAKEKYQKLIKNIPQSTHNVMNHALQIFRDKNKDFGVFCNIIYHTTNDELNALRNEIYFNLRKCNVTNKNELLEVYHNTDFYKQINNIDLLDFDKLANGLINKIGITEMINLINEFNNIYLELIKKSEIKNQYIFLENKLDNIDDIKTYFKNWKKIINKNIEKHNLKVNKLIDKVAVDVIHNENIIVPYQKTCYDLDFNLLNEILNF